MSPTDLCAEMLPIFGIWYGIQYVEGYAGEKWPGLVVPGRVAPLLRSGLFVAISDPCDAPALDFFLYPPDSSGSELHPFGELPGRFEAGNVSEAVKYSFAHLLLRQKLHHELPLLGGSRTSGLVPEAPEL